MLSQLITLTANKMKSIAGGYLKSPSEVFLRTIDIFKIKRRNNVLLLYTRSTKYERVERF